MKNINIKKTGVILTLSAFCIAGNMTMHPTLPIQTVQAATVKSISKVVPVCTVLSRTSTTSKISIREVSGASHYKIYRSTSKSGSFTYIGKTSGLTYKDTGLSAKTKYYYKVQAVNASSKSKQSAVATVSMVPSKVTNVKASEVQNTIKLTWNKVSGNLEYHVYRAASQNGSYVKIGTTAGSMYTDGSIKAGKTYYYKVRSYQVSTGTKYYGAYSSIVSSRVKAEEITQSSYIEEVRRLVNAERKKEGLSQLSTTDSLKKAAHQRAIETKTLFSHDRPDGSSCFTVLEEFGVDYRSAGENIAYGQRTPEEVVTAWMNSEGHRANIMNGSFGKIGIGCYESNGILYWTQLFTN